jgi:hypothetical protein
MDDKRILMKRKFIVSSHFLLIIFYVLLVFCCPAVWASESYEGNSTLQATSILPQKILNSKYYRIDEPVHNDGFTNTYRVYSNSGNYKVHTNIGLFKLLLEIEAIEAMKKVEESDVFVESLKESGAATVEGVKNLVNDPEQTFQNAATGLNALLGRAHESLFQSSPGESEDSRVEQTIGFSHSKRQIAYRYHVDVYSQNSRLQDNLDRIAWAEYAGGLSLGALTMPVGGLAGATLTVSGTTRILGEAIATSSPAELKLRNRNAMEQMRINPNLADIFIENPHYTPLQQTAFVMALDRIKTAKNRSLPLHIACYAANQESATLMTSIMLMLGGYHKNIEPIVQFESLARIFYAVDKQGQAIIALPADYITWNSRLAEGAKSFSGKPGNLLITGLFSERARNELQGLGWTIEEKVARKIGFKYQ